MIVHKLLFTLTAIKDYQVMSEKKKFYVIKFSDGSYYTGLGGTSQQLRHAKIYVSLKYIKETAEWKGYEGYKIIEVDIKEVGEVYGN